MISGSVSVQGNIRISPAHADYIDTGYLETEKSYAWISIEKVRGGSLLSERLWGQEISLSQYADIKKEFMNWPLQSVLLEQDKQTGVVELVRNGHATCPLYLIAQSGQLYFHWDPVELYPYINTSHPLDIEATAAFLGMTREYGEKTLFKNLYLLPERGTAVFDGKAVHIKKPPHIDPSEAVALKEGIDPVDAFINIVDQAVLRFSSDSGDNCAELSSGLDTTLIVNLLCRRASTPLPTFGYCMLDTNREGIRAMRMETLHRLSVVDDFEPIENHLDKAYALSVGKYWPYQTQTAFEKTRFAKKAAQMGKTAVYTGIGGDELCMLTAAERATIGIRPQPVFYNESGDQETSLLSDVFYTAHQDISWPNGYVADSAPDMANSSDFIYLRHGIWPCHPLALAEVHGFTRFLPMEWRRKRRLSREALARFGYSEFFLKQDPKERLSDTMKAILQRVDWSKHLKNAVVFDLGVIDPQKMQHAVSAFKADPDSIVGLSMMTALALELSLQSLSGDSRLSKQA